MADLPEERLDASTAFKNVGVDYFGPFTVKIGRRNEKRWCCLFTCLTVRALHIEVVHKLDMGSCLNKSRNLLHEEANPVQSSATTGQNLLELSESLQSTLLHGTKKGSRNI